MGMDCKRWTKWCFTLLNRYDSGMSQVLLNWQAGKALQEEYGEGCLRIDTPFFDVGDD